MVADIIGENGQALKQHHRVLLLAQGQEVNIFLMNNKPMFDVK